jgi:hypothetical protein
MTVHRDVCRSLFGPPRHTPCLHIFLTLNRFTVVPKLSSGLKLESSQSLIVIVAGETASTGYLGMFVYALF